MKKGLHHRSAHAYLNESLSSDLAQATARSEKGVFWIDAGLMALSCTSRVVVHDRMIVASVACHRECAYVNHDRFEYLCDSEIHQKPTYQRHEN